VISTPVESRTRATLRSAEFGFLGVMILTWVQTPRFCGQPAIAGWRGRRYCWTRALRTSWLIVGIHCSPKNLLFTFRCRQISAGAKLETITVCPRRKLVKREKVISYLYKQRATSL